ncbi:MAG: hypothetical protein H6Q68_2225 [Firmicutes bacterium]|nr:hypothetical protein [Bacillota bacterium]
MNQEFFVDGISAIHVTGNLIRIDLLTLQPQLKSENGQPVVEVNKRLIMPLEAFIQSLAIQQEIVQKLLSTGVLKQNDNASAKTQDKGES